jgi:hypothetical protein
MSESRWNPAANPVAGHWRMLLRNAGEHVAGRAPRIAAGGDSEERLGIPAAEQARLLHAIDFWWLYLGYAGFPAPAIAGAALAIAALAVLAARRLAAVWRFEAWHA